MGTIMSLECFENLVKHVEVEILSDIRSVLENINVYADSRVWESNYGIREYHRRGVINFKSENVNGYNTIMSTISLTFTQGILNMNAWLSRSTEIDLVESVIHRWLVSKGVDILYCNRGAHALKLKETGPKSEKIRPIIESLKPKANSNYLGLNFKRDNSEFVFVPNYELAAVSIFKKPTKEGLSDDKLCDIKSIEEAETFYQSRLDYVKEVYAIEEEAKALIKSYDPHYFYDDKELAAYIYNTRVSLYVKKIVSDKEKTTYKARFNRGYVQNKDLDKLKERLMKKVEDYLKKNRTRAVLKGKTVDVLEKLLFKLYGRNKKVSQFDKLFDTTFTESDLNTHLKPFISDQSLEKLDDEMLEQITARLRENKKKHRINEAYKLGDLYIAISGTKIHILKEDEFKNVQGV